MAKKKKPTISLEGLDDVVFDKKPDIMSAQSILAPHKTEAPETVEESDGKKTAPLPEPVSQDLPVKAEEKADTSEPPVLKKTVRRKNKVQIEEPSVKGTLPPEDKKRASFNIPKDLHRAIKDYSYFNEIDMVEYIFEQLVKPDLKKKGYYPPKKRRH